MGKPLYGLLLGGILGLFDGLTALISAPEVKSDLPLILVGSMGKGLIGGLIIGFIARKLNNLPLGVLVGGLVTGAITYPIASAPASNGNIYFWEILIPGMIVGLIVGYATQKHVAKRKEA
jgi:hypothetical protein